MDKQLVAAITERQKLGYSRETIINDLINSGYSKEMATQVYSDIVQPEPAPIPASAPVMSEPVVVTPPVDNDEVSDSIYNTVESNRGKKNIIFLAIGVVIFLAAVLAGVFLVRGGILGSGLLGNSAPYATEAELVSGITNSMTSMNAYGFDIESEIKFEPREPTTPELGKGEVTDFQEELEKSGFSLPAEGYARFGVSGFIDSRDMENVELDLEINANVLLEPIFFNAAGAVRVVDKKVYGKIIDLPTLYQSFTFGTPINEWILLTEKELDRKDIKSIIDVPAQLIQAVDSTTVAVIEKALPKAGGINFLSGVFSALPKIDKSYSGQLAGAIQALDLNASGLSAEDLLMLVEVERLLQEYPIVRFAGDPEPLSTDSETMYVYHLDIDYDNLVNYSVAVSEAAERIEGGGMLYTKDEVIDLLPSREDFETFNELSDITLTVRQDGSMSNLRIDSVFTLPSEKEKSQIRLRFEFALQRQNDALDITIPESVYPKSIEEIFDEQFGDVRQKGQEAGAKQTILNTQLYAEMVYSESNYSYAEVCSNEMIVNMLESALVNSFSTYIQTDSASNGESITCNDSSKGYAIIAPLLSGGVALCVDSAGFRGEVPYSALSSGTDVNCS